MKNYNHYNNTDFCLFRDRNQAYRNSTKGYHRLFAIVK